jgi:hypothetical protein
MFARLRFHLKLQLKRFIYDLIKTRYDAQTWTRTITCPACDKMIVYDAHYCTYCGQPTIIHNIVQCPFPPNNIVFSRQDTDPILIEPVSVLLPPPSITHRFLAYVRNTKSKAGPATLRHRLQQDQDDLNMPQGVPRARQTQRDTSQTHIIVP